MKKIIKNPMAVWFFRLIRSISLEFKYKKLKIGYMSAVSKDCVFGKNNVIYENVSLSSVEVGDYTYVSNGSNINNASIGKFCSIGPDCKIGLGLHPSHTFVSTHPVFFSTLKQAGVTFSDRNYYSEFKKVEIGNDVWLGANVIVLDGVRIHDGAIVAAGAVVTKDVLPYAIVGGIPARLIKYRFEKEQVEKLIDSHWWDSPSEYLEENFTKFHNIDEFLN